MSEYSFPIHHPSYQYPPSRNPYWTKVQDFRGPVFSDQETEKHAGTWRSQFGLVSEECGKAPLHVEVGCNAGHVILSWAERQPGHLYLGMDWKFKAIFRAASKASAKNLANLKFLRSHAERMSYVFGPEEIDHLYLFFPDPWPKKSQWKNRLITAERLQDLAKIVKADGTFHIKTDHAGYFEWIQKAVAQCKDVWTVAELSTDLHKDHPAPQTLQIPEVTLFEKIFIREQIPIQSLKLQKKKLLI